MTRNDAIDYQYSLAVAGCDHVHDLPLDIHPAVATQLGALPQLGPGVRDCGVSLTRAANDTLRKKNVSPELGLNILCLLRRNLKENKIQIEVIHAIDVASNLILKKVTISLKFSRTMKTNQINKHITRKRIFLKIIQRLITFLGQALKKIFITLIIVCKMKII